MAYFNRVIVDPHLLKRLKKRDKKAQLHFYKQCFNTLMSTCMQYTNNKDDAAAFVNEAFMKVISNIHRIDTQKPIDQWMRKIATNCIIDQFRRDKKRNEIGFEDTHYEAIETQNDIEAHIEQESIEALLNHLPNKTKLVLNLHYKEGYPHKEIAKMLDISIETSKWHIKSARKKLKRILEIN